MGGARSSLNITLPSAGGVGQAGLVDPEVQATREVFEAAEEVRQLEGKLEAKWGELKKNAEEKHADTTDFAIGGMLADHGGGGNKSRGFDAEKADALWAGLNPKIHNQAEKSALLRDAMGIVADLEAADGRYLSARQSSNDRVGTGFSESQAGNRYTQFMGRYNEIFSTGN